MKTIKLTIALGLALATGLAQAAGPLYLWDGGSEPVPYKWDTNNGPIPVYTDGGGAFTWLDEDETEVFISIDRANEITQFAFEQWNNVPTATFNAQIVDTIESQTGLADVVPENADQVYGTENGYGFWVIYDTDGYILESIFGVSRSSVLGIAFPEWADESTGEIIEATALMNGWNVDINDTDGNNVAGVFTHEFGHALNMSHSQTNGTLAYFHTPWQPKYAGPRECVPAGPVGMSSEDIETMYPFISHTTDKGQAQSTVNLPEDFAAISNLYPTDDYLSSTGSISGVLRLKDGKTPYSGINVIARNVNDIYADAISAMTGDQTQGLLGPDGRFTIHNLTPGEQYVLYIEAIWAGGFPTTPMPIISQTEYWNAAESNDPILDDRCEATPITAEAGVTKTADITFNGYSKGIVYTPLVSAFLTDLSKNGRKAAGVAGKTSFVWDQNEGFIVLPEQVVAATSAQLSRNGDKMNVQFDFNGAGIQQAALFDFKGNKSANIINMGDLNGNTCGGGSDNGINSSSSWAIDDSGKTAVGLAYVDANGDGDCQDQRTGDILPFIWDAKLGMRELDTSSVVWSYGYPFVRAHAISGNGKVVLGAAGGAKAVAWVDEGQMIDLYTEHGALEAYAVSYDGSKVALSTRTEGVKLWNAITNDVENIGGLAWCVDMDYVHFFLGNLCTNPDYGPEFVQNMFGPIPVSPSDMTDDGTVIVGRAGSVRTGITGGIWIEDLGWMSLANFFRKQGVMEAFDFPMDNPFAISASGREMVGGLFGVSMSWLVNMDQVYVCQDGKSIQTGFPNGLRNAVAQGAEFGRCDFLD